MMRKNKKGEPEGSDHIGVTAHPGICGFPCVIEARKLNRQTVRIIITQSECEQIQRLSDHLDFLSLKELCTPMTRNPVFINAEKAGCHPTCIIPTAVLKTAEAAMGLALPHEVCICFKPGGGGCDD